MLKSSPEPSERTQSAVPTGGGVLRVLSHPAFLCLLLAVAPLAVFWPVGHYDFTNYDDPSYFSDNAHVLGGLTWPNVRWAFRATDNASWYPLTWLSFLLDATLFGKRAGGPHLVNLLLHTANTVLLFLVLRRLTGAQWRSAFVAALFALHPLHVESVAWIAERKGVLSTLFGLLTLLSYARYAQGRSQVEGRATKDEKPNSRTVVGGPALHYSLALVLFACSLLSKPSLVMLPCAMLLLDYWPLGRLRLSTVNFPLATLLEKTPFFLLGLVSSAITVWVHKESGALTPLAAVHLTARVENAFVSYAQYLGKTLWPTRLAVPYPEPGEWPLGLIVLGGTLVVGLSLLALGLGRQRPYVFVGWFWFLGMLVPVIGLIQWGTQTMADRFTYVPLIGIFIMMAWGAGEVWERRRVPKWAAGAIAVLVLGVCAVRAKDQLRYWQNSESLFRHTLAVTGDNIVALHNLGVALSGLGRSDEAMGCFRRALQIDPKYDEALFDLGNILAGRGQYAEAVIYFEDALRLRPDHFEVRNNLGNTLLKLGRTDAATTQYQLALQLRPEAAKIHKNLAGVLATRGEFDEAILHYREALKQAPNDAGAHYSLGLALAVQGKWDEAIVQYTETLGLTPTNAEAHYNLGYALRVQGRLDEAVAHLREALRLRPQFPLAQYNLGCVLADRGQRDEAIVHLREALRLKPDDDEARQQLRALGASARE